MSRRGKEFSRRVRNRILNRDGGDQVHHKASVKTATKKGVCPDLIKAPINAQGMTEEEHRAYHRENGLGGEDFADYLLTLQPKLFKHENSDS